MEKWALVYRKEKVNIKLIIHLFYRIVAEFNQTYEYPVFTMFSGFLLELSTDLMTLQFELVMYWLDEYFIGTSHVLPN